MIQQLLKERDGSLKTAGLVQVNGAGAQLAPDSKDVASPETYIGFARQQHYASPEAIKQDKTQNYSAPVRPTVNQWGLVGNWNVSGEHATLDRRAGKSYFPISCARFASGFGAGKKWEADAIPREDRWNSAGCGSRSRYG